MATRKHLPLALVVLTVSLALLLLTAAQAAASTIYGFVAAYSYDAQTHHFTGDGGDFTISVNANGHGPWTGGGEHGAVRELVSAVMVPDSVPDVPSHAWLIFDLTGSRTGEWWANVYLQDPLGPLTLEDVFTKDYEGIIAPLNSFLILDDARAVPAPDTLSLIGFVLLLVGVRAFYRPQP